MSDKVKKTKPNPAERFGGPGPGRPPGLPNMNTRILKDAVMMAAELCGADNNGKDGLVGYLRRQAAEQPVAFLSMLGKVIPLQVTHKGQIEVLSKEQRDAAVRNAAPVIQLVANKREG